jgi:hypothetical protein
MIISSVVEADPTKEENRKLVLRWFKSRKDVAFFVAKIM